MSTFVPTPSSVDRRWHVIDAGDQILGRVATMAARLLQGKHKPQYAPFLDTGAFVVFFFAVRCFLAGGARSITVVLRLFAFVAASTVLALVRARSLAVGATAARYRRLPVAVSSLSSVKPSPSVSFVYS